MSVNAVIAGWFTSSSFSHAATREAAAQDLIDLLGENGYEVVKRRPRRSMWLTFQERNAAIRAYNSAARATLERGAMVDSIVDAINQERVAAAGV